MTIVAVVLGSVALGLAFLYWNTRQELAELNTRLNESRQQVQPKSADLEAQIHLRNGLIDLIEVALIVVESPHQRVLLANPTARTLFGKPMVGETLIAATRNLELDRLVASAQTEPDHRAQQVLEIDQRQMRARVAQIENQPGYYGISLRDESEVLRLARARREMVANISHELRHPIGVISLMIDTLLGGALEGKKERKKMLKDMRREIDELTHLVNEMRDLSLIESGQMPVKLMPTQLHDLVESSVASLQTLAESKSQNIRIEIPETVMVLVDAPQIQRVCKNIIHNAIKFAPEEGNIIIKARPSAEDVEVSFENDGPPIPSEDLARLFERFFQVDRARSDGTGLGLAIARHIVLSHGGRIWAVNKPDNEGVIFYFTLAKADSRA